jgi:prophage regulatory protein
MIISPGCFIFLTEISMKNIIKINAVKEQTHLSIASIYRLAKQGDFPKPIKLGVKASGWLQCELDEWIESRLNARDLKAKGDE